MSGEMCGKDFNKKLNITEHLKEQQERFVIPSQRYVNFWYILQNQKVYLKGSFPGSPIYLVKT